MGFQKKELEDRYKIGRKALDDTLKQLGINHTQGYYSDEEVDKWIDPARKMISQGKTLAQVKAWADEMRTNGAPIARTKPDAPDELGFADEAKKGAEQAAATFMDGLIAPALINELKNPMRSISRVMGQMTAQEVRDLMNSDDYQEEVKKLLARGQNATAFESSTPGNLLGEGNFADSDEQEEDLDEWEKPIDVEANELP